MLSVLNLLTSSRFFTGSTIHGRECASSKHLQSSSNRTAPLWNEERLEGGRSGVPCACWSIYGRGGTSRGFHSACVRVISACVYVSFPSGDGWAFFSFINFFKETRLINTHFCNWFCSVENLVRGLLTVLIGSSWNIVLRTLPFRYLTKRVAPKSVFRRHFPWRINVLKCS